MPAPALVVTVDTEADNQWNLDQGLTLDNLEELPGFQSFCASFGVKPTYLCTHEVAVSPRFDAVLADPARRDEAEVGAHLHPWSTPPYVQPEAGPHAKISPSGEQPPGRPYPSELSIEDFERKMRCLTDALTLAAGHRPTSYRAGRWGYAPQHTAVLKRLGYVVDCSVTPETTWQDHVGLRQGGPDFRGAPARPYELSEDDLRAPGASGLIEAPVTIVRTRPLEKLAAVRFAQRFRLPAALLRKSRLARGPRWFRPWPYTTGRDLIEVYNAARTAGLPVVEMMFHSSELLPGGSPFWPDRPAVRNLYGQLAAVFDYARSQGSPGMTLSGFAQQWAEAKLPHALSQATTGESTPARRAA
ncbi:MAG: hypothetical protein AAF288_06790 [Planctomycetota bacterium]